MAEKPSTEPLEDAGSPEVGIEVWLPETGVVTVEEVVGEATTPMGPAAGYVRLSDGSVATPFGPDRPDSLGSHPEAPSDANLVSWGDAERVVTTDMQANRIRRKASPVVGERSGVVFRGGKVGSLSSGVLGTGVIHSAEREIFSGRMRGDRDVDHSGESLIGGEIDWSAPPTGDTEPFDIAGGVTDRLPSTGRFRGRSGVVVVLDRDAIPFSPIDYSYEGLTRRPEAVSQIPQQTVHPLKVNGDLWGAVTPSLNGGFTIEKWGRSGLEEYTGGLFSAESEWVAVEEDPNVRHAIRGVLSVHRGSISESEARSRYRDIANKLPDHPGPLHLVSFPERPEGVKAQSDEELKIADINLVYDGSRFKDDTELL